MTPIRALDIKENFAFPFFFFPTERFHHGILARSQVRLHNTFERFAPWPNQSSSKLGSLLASVPDLVVVGC